MKYHGLFNIFEKAAKFEIIGSTLWAKINKPTSYDDVACSAVKL